MQIVGGHSGGYLFAESLTLCSTEGSQPFGIFQHVECNAAIDAEQGNAVFGLEAAPAVGSGRVQESFHGPQWRLVVEQTARVLPSRMLLHHTLHIAMLSRSALPQL